VPGGLTSCQQEAAGVHHTPTRTSRIMSKPLRTTTMDGPLSVNVTTSSTRNAQARHGEPGQSGRSDAH
jgi:hypothetical protein